MTNKIYNLISESTMSADAAQGRPDLLALTRAVNALIYTDLVATQKTKVPKATLFGMRYLNRDGKMTFQTPATYSGQYGDRAAITEATLTSNVHSGDAIKHNNIVYVATAAGANLNEHPGTTIEERINHAMMEAKLRIASDAAEVNYHDTGDNISEVKFNLDRWAIDTRTRKLKTAVTHELLQDLNANELDGNAVIEDMLSVTLSEEINKDILQKLQNISLRHDCPLAPKGIIDLSGIADDPVQARTVYRLVSDMAYEILSETTFEATFVVCTPRIAALLSASGWMKCDPNMENLYTGILSNGIKVYIDGTSLMDYVVVGTKQTTIDEIESVASLFYSPFVEEDDAGAYTVTSDPSDMQLRLMAMARYGLSVNPYTTKSDVDDQQIYQGDDWNNLAGKSKYSRFIGVKF